MIDIKLSDEGGIDFGKPVDDIEQVKQGITILLETQLGEFIEDKSMGLDIENILGEKYNERIIKDAIQSALQNDAQISQFNNFQISIEKSHRAVLVKLKLYIGSNESDQKDYEEVEVKLDVK